MTHLRHDAAPDVIFVRFERRDMIQMVFSIVVCFAIGCIILALSANVFQRGPLFIAISFFVAGLFPFVVLVVRIAKRVQLRARLNTIPVTRTQRRRLIEALLNLGKLESGVLIGRKYRWDGRRVQTSLAQYGLSLPLCVVDAKMRRTVRKTTRIRELLECEPAGQSLEKSGSLGFFVVGASMLVLPWVLSWFFTGQVWSGCILWTVSLIGLGLCAVAWQRGLVAGHGNISRARGFVIGPGAAGRSDRLWRADQCLTVVRVHNACIYITVLDSVGGLHLKYLERPPESFIDFWQRWMHPNPRPDLVAASVGSREPSNKSPSFVK